MEQGAASSLPREARRYQGQRAGVVSRLVASAIDALVVGAVLLVGYLTYAALRFLLDPRNFTFPDTSVILSLAAGFAVLVAYLTAAWSISGRTYGSLVMGLRVLNRHGEKLRLPGAFLRALACAALPIGLLWCAVSRQNRSLQDLVLRTSVRYDWQPRRPRGSYELDEARRAPGDDPRRAPARRRSAR